MMEYYMVVKKMHTKVCIIYSYIGMNVYGNENIYTYYIELYKHSFQSKFR